MVAGQSLKSEGFQALADLFNLIKSYVTLSSIGCDSDQKAAHFSFHRPPEESKAWI